ncbi:MAG: alkaline phosphatase family protein [Deltaproteobacteria bacterium]|nr:alkaline phosphatase family protein [Deltaproteobacteria bacterium]
MHRRAYPLLLLALAAGCRAAAAQPAPAPVPIDAGAIAQPPRPTTPHAVGGAAPGAPAAAVATPPAVPAAAADAPEPAAAAPSAPAAPDAARVSGAPVAPAAVAPSPAPAAAPAPPDRRRAPVAVAIVVDQLAAWVLRERIDRLPADGGFARLRREGKYFQEMAFAHAITETAPGHASLFTGKPPRDHGIVANDVLGSDGGPRSVLASDQESHKRVTLDGRDLDGLGLSLDNLEAKSSTVEAVFRSRYPKGYGIIAGLSLKDRGAMLAAGDTADHVVWFDPAAGGASGEGKERGGFVTAKRFAAGVTKSGLAAFLGSYLSSDLGDRRDGVARLQDRPWQGLDPAWLRENTGVAGGGDVAGFVAAHTASQAAKPGLAFFALPESDRLLFAMALHLLQAEAKKSPVFLAISLSANDGIGHLFGPDSWEAWDELRRLDGALAWFLSELDRIASGAWSVVLSADHGIAPLEDSPRHPACGRRSLRSALDSGKPCSGEKARGARIDSEELLREAENAAGKAGLRDASGARIGKVVAGLVPPYVYLTEAAKAALAGDAAARNRLASRLDNELRRNFKSVHGVLDVAAFREADACPDERIDRLAALVCNSVSPAPDRGGDFYVVLKPGAFLDPGWVKGAGAGHGSPYGYDRFVPMLVRDANRPELAGQVEDERVPFTQFRDELVRIILSAPAVAR